MIWKPLSFLDGHSKGPGAAEIAKNVLEGRLMDGAEIVERLEQQRSANPGCTQLTIADTEVAALAEHLCWLTDLSAETTAQHMRDGVVTIGGKRLVVLPTDAR